MISNTKNGVEYHDTAIVSSVEVTKPYHQKKSVQKEWLVCKVAEVSNAATIEAFFKGEIPGVRFRNFLSPELCQYFAQKSLEFNFQRYKDAPEVGLIGLALVDSPNLETYLCKAALLRQEGLHFIESLRLLQMVKGALAFHTGRKCKILEYNGKPFWAGNWRLLTGGAGIHLDDISKDAPELADMPVEFQGSFVLHIATPEMGGETVLYDKSAMEEDKLDALYKESGWKYSQAIIEGVRCTTVPAKIGELVMLPTQKYHSVKPSLDKGKERISFSAFYVIKKNDPTIYFYS